MDFQNLAVSGLFMLVLGSALAGMLAVASRRLWVYEDQRIGVVEDMLPKSNCGACGQAGCRAFAEKVVEGAVQPALCSVSSPAQRQSIADFLGVAAGSVEKKVARLACGGGRHVAYLRARYDGFKSCRAAAVVAGGGKECAWGCLGLGDCARVCSFGAIGMDAHGLPYVDTEKCTGCNDCAEICPKGLFSIEPVSRQLWVACKNQAPGPLAEAACEVACNACGKCAVAAAPGLLNLDNNLIAINYDLSDKATKDPVDRCPTGAIVWFKNNGRPIKGASAKKILRNEALPVLH